MIVECRGVPSVSARLRSVAPGAGVNRRGTIVLTTGGDGTRYYRAALATVSQMVDTHVGDGLLAVEVAWDTPGIWGGARARTLACRYATIARWIYNNLHQTALGGRFMAQGTSGGASQIAYGLAHYGLGELITDAHLAGGPPNCPLCSPTPGFGPEPLLSGTPRLNYPNTVVRFFLGADEPTPQIVTDANTYFNAITSSKSFLTVPATAHNVEFTAEGRQALVAAVRQALAAAPTPAPRPTPTSTPPASTSTPLPAQPVEVSFRSAELTLRGFIYKPEGPGPFPVLLWNHGSEQLPGWLPELGPMFASRGYVFFVPHRRGHGRSAGQGPYIGDLLQRELQDKGEAAWSKLLVELLAGPHLDDQIAALSYLKGRPYVDPSRIAIAGCSFGGIQTVLAGEQELGLRAAIDFAGAAQTWNRSSELRERMVRAVRRARVPIYFIQATNDYDLTPSQALAAEMQREGKPHAIKIYPPFGQTAQDGHAFCVRGGNIWASEVFPFLTTQIPTLTPTSSPTPAVRPTPTHVPILPPGVREVNAPPEAVQFAAQWIEVDAPEGRKLLAAVFRPPGDGPFPVVVVLHGRSGFSAGMLRVAEEFAKAGYIGVAGCWFSGTHDPSPPPNPIACPNGPDFQRAIFNSLKPIKALITVAQMLPRADSQQVGLWGISRGATAALLVASTNGVQGVVSDSAIYTRLSPSDTPPLALVRDLAAPVLILHSTADYEVPVQQARDYERALRDLNKPLEAHYYDRAPHGVTSHLSTREDALRRAIAFFGKHLSASAPAGAGPQK